MIQILLWSVSYCDFVGTSVVAAPPELCVAPPELCVAPPELCVTPPELCAWLLGGITF